MFGTKALFLALPLYVILYLLVSPCRNYSTGVFYCFLSAGLVYESFQYLVLVQGFGVCYWCLSTRGREL
uniref:Uncharacterized protein n=1 Tax=Anguilla anguilla TaxID=7936 RepID=A0A0E9PBI2_ANGAN